MISNRSEKNNRIQYLKMTVLRYKFFFLEEFRSGSGCSIWGS